MMKNLTFLSMIFIGLLMASCTSSQVVSDSGNTTTTTKATTQTAANTPQKVDLKAKPAKVMPKKVITKPVAERPPVAAKSHKPNKAGKVIKKTAKVSKSDMPKKVIKPTPPAPAKKVVTKPAIPAKVIKKPAAPVKTDKVEPKVAKIALDEPRYNFGTINEGTIIKRDFKFTNVGEADLLIEIATGSCGCTVPEWPIKPIKPGESDVIHVTFDSTDKEYDTRVEVNIVANTEPIVTEIIMTGKVIPKRDFKKKKH